MGTAHKQLSILDAISEKHTLEPASRFRPPLFSDVPLVLTALALLLFGLLMLYSTSGILSQEKFGESLFYLKRQTIAAVLGCVSIVVLSKIRLSFIKKLSPFFFVGCVFLLLLPLIPGIRAAAGGASRWVDIGGFRFQPGELVKILFISYMAGYFARREEDLKSFVGGIVKPLVLVGLLGVLFLLQPDFGSTALLLVVTLTMGLTAGVRYKHMLISGVFCAFTLTGLVLTSPYRVRRLLSFLEPSADPSGKGYQLIQSLVAVGSGEMSGVGLGASQQKLFFLPAAHTDFIFAVISEELGFVGATFVLMLFLILLWRGLRISLRLSHDMFGFTLGVGVTMLLVVPAFLNMGVVLGLLPTKGIALPFLSYGGTNVLMSLVAVGILLCLARESVESFSHDR